ncbi:MAG TPA: ABC transporter substrate-binding protein [Clostridia bacterium]|jgi:iron complex transport system substrate-binding protein|nr:MAG: Vitamin B12-binding protein precursor [Firmicutes bacterium ADurb.Bin248]HOG01934.1 ABC transporter substrate-binding protein [Clostridia bacterium]HOS18453.1 ABC transporter substrate-binding protein [Clostridia bacterium]HPK16339.1 ABC transporter substrate-binding protein [Clostridia bacterium]
MKHPKTASLALVLALLLALAAGCGGNAAGGPTAAPTLAPSAAPTAALTPEPTVDASVTVTDMTGKEVTLPAPATKIVALTASDCEILYAIGAGTTLVGRGTYCDYPAEVAQVPSVQSGPDTNIEQIIALAPQAVVMSTMAQTEEQIAQIEAAGIRVVVSDAQDIAGVYTAIGLLGRLTGHDAEAAALVDSMKSTFETVAAQAEAKGAGGTIYFEVSPLQYGLWTAGGGTFMDEVAGMLGLTNVFSDLSGWAEVSEEQVIARNPDYILTVSMYYGEGPTPEQEILSRAGWENIPAVKNGAILNLQNNELSRPGPRLADGAQMLYDFIFVELAQQDAA